MNKNSNWVEEAITTSFAFFFAAAILCVGLLLKKVLVPVVRFILTKTWSLVRTQFGKLFAKRPKVQSSSLPTPDIFKGATNLAPAKQLKF